MRLVQREEEEEGKKKNHDPYSIHELISSMDPVETSLYVSLPCTAKEMENGRVEKRKRPSIRTKEMELLELL